MPIPAGTRLGGYEITSVLGAGGMGEVYRARDTRLHRDVAVKILPEVFALDADRLARFEREAQTLAALNHPNIAQIFGVVDRPPALVMECVNGEDLAERIARGPIPPQEAIEIARQIADALEAAHDRGIVHRDLKPANIKISPAGAVKVLDFGLARAMSMEDTPGSGLSRDLANSPTFASPAVTAMGMLLGTAAYMSPEQARGKAADRRADIWAFGAVLFEMLTGMPAFKGDDMSEVLAGVLKDEPAWTALPEGVPASVRRLLKRCLEKDPRKRLSAIGDARFDLDDVEAVQSGGRHGRRFGGAALITGVGAAIVATAIVTRYAIAPPTATPARVMRVSLSLPDGDSIALTNLLPLAISPDGSHVAYVAISDGVQRLFLRNLADAEPTPVAGSEGARCPFFSPDGQWVGFFADNRLKKLAVASMAIEDITGGILDARGGAWAPDGDIYYTPNNFTGLWRVAASGGAPAEFTTLDASRGEISHRWPHVLPGGKAILFTVWTGPGPDERAVVSMPLPAGPRTGIVRGGDTGRYLPMGLLTYGRLDHLFALPWKPGTTGSGVPPISLPEFPRLENEGAADYAISMNGTLAYLAGGDDRYLQRIVWVDRASGATEELPIPRRDFEGVSLSPDGTRAVVQVREGAIGLWIYDFARHSFTPLATPGGSSQAGIWTPDNRVVYRCTRNGRRNLCARNADGSGDEQQLTSKPNVIQTPASISSDGEWLLYTEAGGPNVVSSAGAMRLRGDPAPRVLVEPAVDPQISPDGKWVAYESVSASSGQSEIYATSFSGGGQRIPISVNGGSSPLWSRDGRELYYLHRAQMMAVSITSGATLGVSAPRVLHEGSFRPMPNLFSAYGVSADGRRFLRIQQLQPQHPLTKIEVVLNWATQLQK